MIDEIQHAMDGYETGFNHLRPHAAMRLRTEPKEAGFAAGWQPAYQAPSLEELSPAERLAALKRMPSALLQALADEGFDFPPQPAAQEPPAKSPQQRRHENARALARLRDEERRQSDASEPGTSPTAAGSQDVGIRCPQCSQYFWVYAPAAAETSDLLRFTQKQRLPQHDDPSRGRRCGGSGGPPGGATFGERAPEPPRPTEVAIEPPQPDPVRRISDLVGLVAELTVKAAQVAAWDQTLAEGYLMRAAIAINATFPQ